MAFNMPTRRLVNQQDAAMIESARVPRSRFKGSWTRKTAFDAGYLVPILVEEVLPGDHLSYNVTAYVRLQTPLFPLMDNQRIDTFFFFVPARLLWDNWQKFMGEQLNPGQTIDFSIPQLELQSPQPVGSIFDHMGLPVLGQHSPGQIISVTALPFRAYNLIYNEWFRDENLQNSQFALTTDGPDSTAIYGLLRRAKSHDYFTSALPWPQKFTAPTVAVGGLAPVTGIGHNAATNAVAGPSGNMWETAGPVLTYANYIYASQASGTAIKTDGSGTTARPMIYADLSQATGVQINVLRQAWLVQDLLERDARGGTRYVEIIRSHFGVTSPDFRLTRPEYIGGGQSPLMITPVAQTAPTTGATVGALGAAGTSVGSHRATYAATEHGFILGLINVRTELTYQQGIERFWMRKTRYDFAWPSLAGLGEQAILRQEIYATGVDSNDSTVFGYQERWHEYRTRVSDATGVMRSTAAGTLDMWHLGQKFLSAPVLDAAFIVDDPPMTRVLAAGSLATNQQYLADILFERDAVRPIPIYGTPVSLGRF